MHVKRNHILLFAIVFLTVTAGCLGSQAPDEVGPQEVEPETNSLGDDPPQNPWLTEEITVSIVYQTDQKRHYEPLIEESLEYWNENMTEVGWEGEFVYEDIHDPDIPVEIKDEIEQQEYDDRELETVGWAPLHFYPGEGNERDEPVVIKSGLNDTSTVNVATHEFGHALGLRHEAEDEFPVMAAEMATATQPQPSIYERDNPWPDDTVLVYYDSSSELRDHHIRPLEEAREYYDDGAGGWLPDDVSVERTKDADKAHVTVRLVDDTDGGDHLWQWWGFDNDADGEINEMDEGEIQIERQISDDRITWGFGHALGQMFGVRDKSEMPDPFDESRIYDPNNW